MSGGIVIRLARAGTGDVAGMAAVLHDCVAGGASVGFMLPFDLARAEAFWVAALDSETRGERVVLVAEDTGPGVVVGTVQVVFANQENQPHRGEIAKMLVHRAARRRGIAEALLRAAEDAARDAGRSVLVLDTASDDAERLYDRLGWQRVGVIPDYALLPAGGLVDTIVYYKRLDEPAPPATTGAASSR